MRNYKRRLNLAHVALAENSIPHATDATLEEVLELLDRYKPGEPMTPNDGRRWLAALKEGYELKSKA